MDEISTGMTVANQAVTTFQGALKLFKDARAAVKGGGEEADERLEELRETMHAALDQLIDLKAQHLALLEKNLQLTKVNDLRNSYRLEQVSEIGEAYVRVPIHPEEGLESLKLCPVCFEKDVLSPLQFNSDRIGRCPDTACKFTVQIKPNPPKQRRVVRSQNSWLAR